MYNKLNTTLKMNNDIKMSKVLIFDTETTGLIPNRIDSLANCPYLLQLSFIIFNFNTRSIDKIYNEYVQIPNDINYDEEKIYQITGITREKCNHVGKPISDVLSEFYEAYTQVDGVVAHNINFDRKIILIELMRNKLDDKYSMFNMILEKKEECTMLLSRNLCNITAINKNGQSYVKYPTLSELYTRLFNVVPTNLHNACMDTIYCMRCYLKLQYNIDIPNSLFNLLSYQ